MFMVPFQNKFVNPNEGCIDVPVNEVARLKGNFLMVDVRRPDEFHGELGHVEGSLFVTLETDFENWLKQSPKDQSYVFICRSGGRSGRAAALASSCGFREVYNMAGGMIAWNQAGLPVKKNKF